MDANFLVRFDVCQSCKGNVNNGWWAMHFLVLEVPLWRVLEYRIGGDGMTAVVSEPGRAARQGQSQKQLPGMHADGREAEKHCLCDWKSFFCSKKTFLNSNPSKVS